MLWQAAAAEASGGGDVDVILPYKKCVSDGRTLAYLWRGRVWRRAAAARNNQTNAAAAAAVVNAAGAAECWPRYCTDALHSLTTLAKPSMQSFQSR